MTTTEQNLANLTINGKHDETRTHTVVTWHGKKDIRVSKAAVPLVTDPEDAIIKVTSTAICGSDLHIYVNAMPGMKSGDILGHEAMGVVEDAGPATKLKKGDRVVCSFDLGCGKCFYCKQGVYTGCETTNPEDSNLMSTAQKKLYGHNTSGMHGYSHLTGGWEGGQATYMRVCFADTNCLKVPDNLSDDQVLLLSDVLATSWHATELGGVGQGDSVAVWGAGPVGILAAQCAYARGAKEVFIIDNVAYRLAHATRVVPGVRAIDFSKEKVYDTLLAATANHGPDVAIEAVGFHYCKSWMHTIEMALMLETDPAEILNELITCVRKGGRIGVVGVYAGYCNHYAIGAFMEKGLTMRAGQTPVQKYWHHLLEMIKTKKLDPTVVITHHLPLEQAPEGYRIFNDKLDNCIKVVLKP